jgi:hypothetical protein
MDEIFGDSDVRRVFETVSGGVAPRLDDLDARDRELMMQFMRADQNPDKLATPAMLIDACVGGVRAFEYLSDPMARSWAAGWKKFVLYITALNTQTLWDRFQKDGRSDETAIFADWVVFSIGHEGWGPDGNSTPLGKQHSYCMAVAAEAGGGIKKNPRTGLFEAPDGSAARNYDPPVHRPAGPAGGTPGGSVAAGTDGRDGSTVVSRGAPAAEPAGASRWDAVRNRARQAQQHVNPVALQHGIESVHGALTEARLAKVDKDTGRLKIRKLGVAQAALRPAKAMRQVIDGAAVYEHLRAYNESARPGPQGAAGSDSQAGGPDAGNSPAEFASYQSKRDYLRDWARLLVVASAVAPTEALITEHANMAAAGIGLMVFLRLGAPRGITDLGQFFRPGPMPGGTPLETFDVLYAKVVKSQIGQQAVDEGIIALLNSSWNDWRQGIRGHQC